MTQPDTRERTAREAHSRPAAGPALEILIANERNERLQVIADLVRRLGHEIVADTLSVEDVGPLSRERMPDVALVGLGDDGGHALEMISRLVREAACPVIALLDTTDDGYVSEAAKRGIFAYIVMSETTVELQNALDITLRRFAEFHNLEGAFGRRAIIEQAKGILMARNSIDANTAHQRLKTRSQQTGAKLSDIAQTIINAHLELTGL